MVLFYNFISQCSLLLYYYYCPLLLYYYYCPLLLYYYLPALVSLQEFQIWRYQFGSAVDWIFWTLWQML